MSIGPGSAWWGQDEVDTAYLAQLLGNDQTQAIFTQ
jgi:hypothetical protein